MRISYSSHLEQRLRLRHIDDELPRLIFESPDVTLVDTETGYGIAVKRVFLYDKSREAMVAYERIAADAVRLLTIHPLKEGQKENRIQSGRWRVIDE